ncbi:hypothetical protein DOK67_0001450 [Enterococcus sp. DIV0212c]|uniref:helix-turn-helix domain-containing protein n=1 Tax=Enterococcus sp. DIV0212c TaxID=2230867 RepID=UPI001A9B8C29|nr:helix-turn-helix domain-containing protein [Enterococcus sp. DIV0212c]MBO1354342.1 helix-turn-helix domain-containing protein [Enterococcus sp. DIV0212c]
MKKFFMKKNDQQKFEIFKLILFSKNGASVHSISQKTNLSLNLVYKKIKLLNDDLEELFCQNNVRIIKNDAFFSIVIENPLNISYVIDALRLYYIQQSHEYLILHSILLNHFNSVEALSQEINLSTSHTYKSLSTVSWALSNFKLELRFPGENQQSNIQGLEIHIRLFIFYYYWSVFKGITWPFRKSLDHLKQIDLPIKEVSPSQEIRLKYYQTLSLWRILYKNELVVLDSEFLSIVTLLNTVHPIVFSTELKLTDEERLQEEGYFSLLCRLFIYDTDTISQKLETATLFIQSDLPISKSCTFVLDGLYAAYDVTPTNEDYLFSYYSLLLALTSISYVKIDNTPLFENDQNISELGSDLADFPQMEHELSELAKKLFSDAPYLDELKAKGFFTYIVFLFYFILDCSKKSQQLKIFVQYSKNHFTTEEIKKSLASFFSDKAIVFVSDPKQSNIMISDCFEKDYPNENFFYFDNPVNINEWQALIRYVSTKLYNKIFYKQL